jgi:hypothetical protein
MTARGWGRVARLPLGTLLVAAVALFIPFFNYGVTGEFIGGDAADAWAFPAQWLHALLGVFLDFPGLGQNGAEGIQGIFPTLSLASALHAVGIPTAVGARLMIALDLFGAMAGALALCTALLGDRTSGLNRCAALAGALFYGVNHFTIHMFWTVQTYYPLVYVALPWLIYGVVLGCESSPRRGVALIAFALLWADGAATNPALYGMALCAVIVGGLLELAQGVPLRRVAAVCAAGLGLGLAVCAWSLIPIVTRVTTGLGQVSAWGSDQWVGWMSERSSFAHLFKLDGYTGGTLMAGSAWYTSALGDLVGYLPLIVAIAGFGVVRRRLSRAALGAYAVAIMLGAGVHPPLGALYQALMDYVPGFVIYRSPYDKWTQLAAVLLSVLFALGIVGAVRRCLTLGRTELGRVLLAAVVVCALAPVALYPWPVYAGKLLYQAPGVVKFVSTIPPDYARVAEIVRRNAGATRTVTFDGGGFPYPTFLWGYFGEDPLLVATETPVSGIEEVVPRGAWMSARTVLAALRSLSVRYIVVHHDGADPAPSPDIRWLVGLGAASLVYDGPTLSLYELRTSPKRFVAIEHEPTLVPRTGIYAGEREADQSQTGRLDPNLGYLLAEDGRRTFAMPLGLASPAPALTQTLSSLTDVTAAPRAAPGTAYAFVPANPLAMVFERARCGARDAVRIEAPTRWRIGATAIPQYARTFCLGHTFAGTLALDGKDVSVGNQQFTLPNRPDDHAVAVAEIARRAAVQATRLDYPGLPYRFVLTSADAVAIDLPRDVRLLGPTATVKSGDGTILGSARVDVGAATVVVPFQNRVCCGPLVAFVTFHGGAPGLGRALSAHAALPIAQGSSITEHLAFRLDQRSLDSTRLPVRDIAAGAHETVAWRPRASDDPPSLAVAHNPWLAEDGSAVRHEQNGDVLLGTGDAVDEIHTSGQFFVSDRYRLHFAYTATGFGEVWVNLDGYEDDRIVHLVTDGKPHLFDEMLFPPTDQSGKYYLRIRVSRGTIRIAQLRLAADGPNGNVLALRPRPALGGHVVSTRRTTPWRFDVTVRDCAPCALRLGMSIPPYWFVRGATVRGALEGQGASTGRQWGGVTTGAATWLLDAGPGVAHLTIFFLPALLAIAGLAITVPALVVVGLLAFGRDRRVPAPAPPGGGGPGRLGVLEVAALLLAVVTPLLGDAALGELTGDALWFLLALIALGAGSLLRRGTEARP